MSNTVSRTATIIANHVNENVRFETEAQTFGELKEEPKASNLFSGNIRVIVRQNRNELSMDKSKLPDGDFTLIVVADKVKSGTDEYDEMGYHALRQECIDRGFDTDKYNGPGVTMNIMRAHLRDNDQESISSSDPVSNAPETVVVDASDDTDTGSSNRFEEMKERIDNAVANCREEVNDILQEYADILPDSVIPDYTDLIEEVKNDLGV